MPKMPEKIASFASYCVATVLIWLGGFTDWLRHVDWNQVAVIGGFLLGVATYITTTYFEWRRTRAYEKGVEAGIISEPPEHRTLFGRGEK